MVLVAVVADAAAAVMMTTIFSFRLSGPLCVLFFFLFFFYNINLDFYKKFNKEKNRSNFFYKISHVSK